jgi:hypothetical protein
VRKLLLDRARPRTARPPPQIITLPALVFLGSIHARCDAPHDQIAQHDGPTERRRDLAGGICLVDAEPVRGDGCKVEHDGHGRGGKVHPRRPGAGPFRPGGARDGVPVCVRHGAVGVLRAEEFDERHGDGDEDGEGDEEGDGAGEGAEVADACFEGLSELTWAIKREAGVCHVRHLRLTHLSNCRSLRAWGRSGMSSPAHARRDAVASEAKGVREKTQAMDVLERIQVRTC